jgi:large repetitive protein
MHRLISTLLLVAFWSGTSAYAQLTISAGPITAVGNHTVEVVLSDVAANPFNVFYFEVVSSSPDVTVTGVDVAGTLSSGLTVLIPSTASLPFVQGANYDTAPITSDGTLVRLLVTVGEGVTNASIALDGAQFRLGGTTLALSPASPVIQIAIVPNSDPETPGGTATVAAGGSTGGTVTATDADSDPLTFSKASEPSSGTATVSGSGVFTYEHDGSTSLTDSFTYTVTDGNGGSVTGTVDVTITNEAPTSTDFSVTTNVDTALIITLVATDPEGLPLTYSVVGAPPSGSALSGVTGTSITYTPVTGFSGPDYFTYKANDGVQDSNTGTVSITVNQLPVTGGGTATVVVGESTTGTIPATDGDGDLLTFTLDTNGSNGTAIVSTNGDFTYTHGGSATTSDAFTYDVSDGNGGTASGTVNVTVTNQSPTASAISTETNVDIAILVTLSATDPEGFPLTYSIVDGPSTGSLSSISGGAVTYTPGAIGLDTFTYKANDGLTDSNTATVSIEVAAANQVPSTDGGTASVIVGGSTSGTVTATDGDGDDLAFSLATNPAAGTATVSGVGAFTYAHDGSATTSDSFTYQVSDGNGGTATGTVTVTIVNQAPTASPVSATTEIEQAVATTLLATDPEALPLTFSIVDGPSNGALSAVAGNAVTYTPGAGFSGSDSFTFRANDGLNDSNTATATITVNPNVAPSTEDDGYDTNEDTQLSIAAPGVLTNDTDANGNSFTAAVETSPDHGSLSLLPDGSFVYEPDDEFNGVDVFTYTATDGSDVSSPATVTIQVLPVNDPPVADNASVSARGPAPLEITLVATDQESDPLTFSILAPPVKGTLSAVVGNMVTYTANPGESGSDNFVFRANDGADNSNNATVAITIEAINQGPTANPDFYGIDEDGFLGVPAPGVLINDTDPENDALTATIVSQTSNGTTTLQPDGSFLYEPDADFNGADSFRYEISDGQLTSQAVATIEVAPTGSGLVQLVHAAPDAAIDPADIYVNGSLFATDASYLFASPYLSVPDGPVEVKVAPARTTIGDAVATFIVQVDEDASTTAVINGNAANGYDMQALGTMSASSNPSLVDVLFFNGVRTLNVSIVVIPDEIFVGTNLAYEQATAYLGVAADSYDFSVRLISGTQLDAFRLSLTDQGLAYAAMVVGILNDGVYPLEMVSVDGAGNVGRGLVVTDTEPDFDMVPKTFLLRGNYPNPFNPRTTIQFDLPEAAEVAVRVTDLLGREMLRIPSQALQAGTNLSIPIDASELSSGIYIYRVEVRTALDVHVSTGTMTLIK